MLSTNDELEIIGIYMNKLAKQKKISIGKD